MSAPYTHAEHARRCCAAAHARQVLQQRVQVMRRGVLYCAQIVQAWTTPTGVDCWTVETDWPERARYTVPAKNVRACDHCSCIDPLTLAAAGAAQAQRAAPAAAGAWEA